MVKQRTWGPFLRLALPSPAAGLTWLSRNGFPSSTGSLPWPRAIRCQTANMGPVSSPRLALARGGAYLAQDERIPDGERILPSVTLVTVGHAGPACCALRPVALGRLARLFAQLVVDAAQLPQTRFRSR